MIKKLLGLFRWNRKPLHETTVIIDGEATPETIKRDRDGRRYVAYSHTCCDCGLNHEVIIEVKRKKLVFYYWRK